MQKERVSKYLSLYFSLKNPAGIEATPYAIKKMEVVQPRLSLSRN